MEALTGIMTALLTIYDMCKAVDKSMKIENVHLIEKTGGKSGEYHWKESGTADDGADYSDIEPEEDEEEEYVPTPEEVRELEEEEELGAYYPDSNPDFATGYSFEDLKKVHRVLVSDDADEKAEREAREVLPSVMGSDIWEPMLDAFEGARQRVARLMKNHNV